MLKNSYLLRAFIVGIAISFVLISRSFRGVPAPLKLESNKIRGSLHAKVTLTEFSDFQCGFCMLLGSKLKSILKIFDGQLKIQYKHFPLTKIHPYAMKLAEASECAADQGKFFEYHDLIFDHLREIQVLPKLEPRLMEYADQLKLERNQFESCLDKGIKREIVLNDKEEGRRYFVSWTPTLILNGHKVLVSEDEQDIITAVKEEIKRLGL